MSSFFAGVLLMLLTACSPPVPVTQEAYVFGTRVEVRVWGVAEQEAHAALGEVLREFDIMHKAYHAWQPSELTALNAALGAGRPHDVSPELAALIRNAQTLAAQGDYLFDPGIGGLVSLWGFHNDEFKAELPDADTLARQMAAKPTIAALTVDGLRVTSKNLSVALDFGGYLKGVALDRAANLLRARGVEHALVNIGGNVLALGNRDGKPGGQAWRVGIQHPRASSVGNVPLASLELRDGEAIGTSGDYHRFFELEGKRYCHLIDPRTGYPATGAQSVTILIPPAADTGMRSDALSKPLFISGDGWPEMARRLDVAFVLRVGADGTAVATPAMKQRLTIEAPGVQLKVAG